MAVSGARERIMLAAERLIAERGPHVPLRDIAVAAEQRNNSAVQYHFGSRDGLFGAIVEHRIAALEQRRLELLAEHEAAGDAHDARVLLELLVVPMLDVPYHQGSTHYARFLEQIRNHPAVADQANLAGEARAAVRIIISRLERALSDLSPDSRHGRLRAIPTVMFSLLADRERAVEAGEIRADDVDVACDIVDMLTGLVTAPQTRPLVKG